MNMPPSVRKKNGRESGSADRSVRKKNGRESGNADRSVRKKNSGESGNAGRSVLKKSGGKGSGKSCRTEAGQIGRWNCQKARRSSERKIKGDVKKEKETKTGSI